MIRQPPRSTLDRSSAASDVYKRQLKNFISPNPSTLNKIILFKETSTIDLKQAEEQFLEWKKDPVSYTHLRAHETVLDLVCRLLLEKKKKNT